MGDLNRDLRVVWERDYSHLMYRRKDTPRNYFGYKGYEFQLGAIYQTLFVVRQDDVGYLAASIEVDELKSKYFLDILNPSKNELVLFELEYGFEFPFCEKNKKINIKENNMNEEENKKWNEWPFSFPPVNTLALVEFDTARDEWYRGFIICYGMDECGCYCQFQWLEGPKTNQTAYYYTPESFRPLLPAQNKEQKDSPKQEKCLDNLLKELHNLKQEEKELSAKVDNILKEINELAESLGIGIIIK